MQAYVYRIICFSEISLPRADLLPALIVLTSTHECSAYPIQRIFEVTLHDKKPRTFVYGKDYLWCHRWLLTSWISLTVQINQLLSKVSLLWLNFVYSLQNVSRVSCNYPSEYPSNKFLITVFNWFILFLFDLLRTYSLMWIISHNIQIVTS